MRSATPYLAPFREILTGIACLAVLGGLAGCASKNPLIDEPLASARPAASEAAGARAEQSGNAASGVQTTKEKRFLGFLSPYRPDIPQGNFVSQEMVAQLKEGMTREQVLFVLGTPLLNDIFHAERWDYVFRYKKGNGEITDSKVTVFFKDNRLARYEGGNLPTEEEYLALIAGKPKTGTPARPASAPQAPSSAVAP